MGDNKEQTDIQSLLAQKDTSKLSSFLKEQIVEYKNSEMFKNYLDFVAKCPRYSNRNIRFLIKQKPDIGRVGTFTKWKEQGLHIKKGSKGYKIFMPIIKDKYDNGKPVLDEKGKKVREVKGFKLGTVFEDKQLVEYENLPKQVEYLNQDPNNTKDLFMALSEVSEVKIGLKPLEVDGFYSPQDKCIFINANLHGADLIHTLIHEVTHSKLHTKSEAIFGDKQYTLQELEAESTAYIVANNYDIDTSKYTMGYLNSWGLDKISNEELQGVMENIQKTAREIIEKIDLELEKRKNIEPTKSKLQTEIQEAKKEQKELLKKHEEKQKKKPKKESKLDSFKNKFKGKGE
ncbi:TPA: ImmA/IrrE family metallo-endopeptidase [Enterococcus faecium]|nr:ImmA/IrrE family metallo-endopeptidase [Enterococcus faecium]